MLAGQPMVLAIELPPQLPIDSIVCHPAKPNDRYRCWHNPSAGPNPTVWSRCSPSGEFHRKSYTWWNVLFTEFGGLVEVVAAPTSCNVPAGAILHWQVPAELPLGSIVAACAHGYRYQRRPSALDGEILWIPLDNDIAFPRTWLELLTTIGPVTVLSDPAN